MIARGLKRWGDKGTRGQGDKAGLQVSHSPALPVDSDAYTARAIAGSLQAPLNAAQKQAICTAARLAYDGKGGSATGLSFEEFRHEQQELACGVASLRECRQHHFKLLQGHFDLLNGRTVQAFRKFAGATGASQARELALAKLMREAQAAFAAKGSTFKNAQAAYDYVAGFLRNKRKVVLENADAKDIWHGIITLRNKVASFGRTAQEKGRQGDQGTGGQGAGENISLPVSSSPGLPVSAPQGSAKTRHNAILGGGGAGRAQDRDFSGDEIRRTLRDDSADFKGAP